jgi:NADPH-dependent 2,4-dienoyl-CoA reductase/sulfur reductase-like enzyme/rhodanese-related sulfurtransferase
MMTDKDRSDVVIIGGVAAGPKAAAALARRMPDLKITLFEKGDLISYGTCGMPYFASGDISSFEELNVTSYGVTRNVAFFRDFKGIEVVTGAEVTAIDREARKVTVKKSTDGSSLEHGYNKLVIATGANPVPPPFPVADCDRITPFTRPANALNFRRGAQQGKIGKVAIVGGGFIGCEVAESAAGLWGIETVLIEKEKQVLPYVLDYDMAEMVRSELLRQDVTVMTDSLVEKIDLDDDGNPVVHVKGEEPISADYVFLCLGVRPEVTLASECGLEIGSTGGIWVDAHMKTSDENIFAGGDCVESVHQLTGNQIYMPMGSLANRHGRVIAENIAGNESTFPGVLGAFLVKVFDLNVGTVGLNMTAAKAAGIDAKSLWGSFPDKPDYYPEVKTLSAKMVYSESDGKLLGLQVVGTGDICRRVDVFSVFLQNKATTSDLLDLENGYAPPYSEALDPLFHLASVAQAISRGIRMVAPRFNHNDSSLLHKDIIWLDVRETAEAEEKPWPCRGGKLLSIPLGTLRSRLNEIDRNKSVLVVCRRGVRSYQAAVILKQAGFEDVQIVGGGTQAALS